MTTTIIIERTKCNLHICDGHFDVIMYCSYRNLLDSEELIKFFVEKGVNPHRILNNRSALSYACSVESISFLKNMESILANEVVLNRMDNYNVNPIRRIMTRIVEAEEFASLLKIWIEKYPSLDLKLMILVGIYVLLQLMKVFWNMWKKFSRF